MSYTPLIEIRSFTKYQRTFFVSKIYLRIIIRSESRPSLPCSYTPRQMDTNGGKSDDVTWHFERRDFGSRETSQTHTYTPVAKRASEIASAIVIGVWRRPFESAECNSHNPVKVCHVPVHVARTYRGAWFYAWLPPRERSLPSNDFSVVQDSSNCFFPTRYTDRRIGSNPLLNPRTLVFPIGSRDKFFLTLTWIVNFVVFSSTIFHEMLLLLH